MRYEHYRNVSICIRRVKLEVDFTNNIFTELFSFSFVSITMEKAIKKRVNIAHSYEEFSLDRCEAMARNKNMGRCVAIVHGPFNIKMRNQELTMEQILSGDIRGLFFTENMSEQNVTFKEEPERLTMLNKIFRLKTCRVKWTHDNKEFVLMFKNKLDFRAFRDGYQKCISVVTPSSETKTLTTPSLQTNMKGNLKRPVLQTSQPVINNFERSMDQLVKATENLILAVGRTQGTNRTNDESQ